MRFILGLFIGLGLGYGIAILTTPQKEKPSQRPT